MLISMGGGAVKLAGGIDMGLSRWLEKRQVGGRQRGGTVALDKWKTTVRSVSQLEKNKTSD